MSAEPRKSARGVMDMSRRWRAPARRMVAAAGLSELPYHTPLWRAERTAWSCRVHRQNGAAGGRRIALMGKRPVVSQAADSSWRQSHCGVSAKWIQAHTMLPGPTP